MGANYFNVCIIPSKRRIKNLDNVDGSPILGVPPFGWSHIPLSWVVASLHLPIRPAMRQTLCF
uniref:Uncharacterized protein n=1 Tax=Cannabis sativa TaxID=3483 RepID=A0A803RBJ0_CANSA